MRYGYFFRYPQSIEDSQPISVTNKKSANKDILASRVKQNQDMTSRYFGSIWMIMYVSECFINL